MAYSVSTFGKWQWIVLAVAFAGIGLLVVVDGANWSEKGFGLLFVALGGIAGLAAYFTARAIKRP